MEILHACLLKMALSVLLNFCVATLTVHVRQIRLPLGIDLPYIGGVNFELACRRFVV